MTTTPTWINGHDTTLVPVTDRGLTYGDGLFETIRIVRRQLTLATEHWQRLQYGCLRLNIAVDIEALKAEVSAYLRTLNDPVGVLKITITRGVGSRGYNPLSATSPHRILSFTPTSFEPSAVALHGANVRMCQTWLGSSTLAGIKHLNRLEQVLARSEWRDEYDEGLVCDEHGHLIEGTMSNLFVVTEQGQLLTPDLARCGVAGVCREFILNWAAHQGYAIVVGKVEPDLSDARELFLCNSVMGVWPVVTLNDRQWPIGSVTRKIQDVVWEALNG